MASGGFMNLAYMAELSVVVNLAYLELKSLRYIQAARESVMNILRKLSDDNKNQNGGTVVGNEQFMALYQQAKNIFHDDKYEREKEWYVPTDLKGEKKEWYKFCATYIYAIFVGDRDKKIATVFLISAGVAIFAITLLDRVGVMIVISDLCSAIIWWLLFGLLATGIVIPTLFVILGRHLNKVVSRISKSIEIERMNWPGPLLMKE